MQLPAPGSRGSPALLRLGRTLARFLQIEAASGIILLAAAALAMTWANSAWSEGYAALWHTPLALRVAGFGLERTLEWFVNDVLMVVFFFVVGLELRREQHHGSLSDVRRALLPALAAIGGMVAPALVYLALAGERQTRAGWGIPMATDIAFAVGVLALLGRRVPAELRVLLLALAVIDDLGAILVIALFYSSGVKPPGLTFAALGLGAIVGMRALGVRAKLAYVIPAALVWAGVYAAGVHPTIAGVVIGLMTPVHSDAEAPRSPADELIDMLHPWVAYGILPVFALANAGVPLAGVAFEPETARITLGVAFGLWLGKPVGVLAACALTLRGGFAALPSTLGWRHLCVLGLTAGIGFTMALFVAQLAFADPSRLTAAKLGVLGASALAVITSLIAGRLLLTAADTQR
jgi:NhaA family Na+:H+ antiporter